MVRTLTANAATEAAKATGAFPRRILEIQWGGATGTLYYSDEPLATADGDPVNAAGIVLDWGELHLQAEPGRIGGHGDVKLELADSDYTLKTLFETEPGPQNKTAYIHLWFVGTTWPTDRVTLFGGMLTAPLSFEMTRGAWSVSVKGFEHLLDREIGLRMTGGIFPEIACNPQEGTIIPVVFGEDVRRVPCHVIDRPGYANVGTTLQVLDGALYIHASAADTGFTLDTAIQLIVGGPGRWERLFGSFNDAGDRTEFNITSRGAILAEGNLSFFGSGGVRYLTVPKADLPDLGATSRAGYPLYVKQANGVWVATMITQWDFEASSIVVAYKGNLNVTLGADYKIGSLPGDIPIWPAGTPVYEVGTWKYACSHLPSAGVSRVEGRGSISLPGGENREIFMTINPVYYSVDLDDNAYNANLGRDGGDPGICTISLLFNPVEQGLAEETIYVTLDGVTDDNTTSGTVLTDPADIIKNLLENEFLGNIGSSFINATSFTSAAGTTATVVMAAILEQRPLSDLVGELAQQAACLLFWDQGQAHLQAMSNTLSGSQLTLTEANTKPTVKIEDQSVKDTVVTEVTGKFRLATPSPETGLVRKSSEAEGYWGKKSKEINLSAYQAPTSVALMTEFWLQYWLNLHRVVTVETFLPALKIQPGDVVTLDIADGAGADLFDSVLARVRSVRHQAGNAQRQTMERITLVLEVKLWTIAIDSETAPDDTCHTALNETQPIAGFPEYQQVHTDGSSASVVLMVGMGEQRVPFNERPAANGLPDPWDASIVEGFLDGDLDEAAGNDPGDEAAARLSVWQKVGNVWSDSGHSVEVVNRDQTNSATSGTYLVAVLINGEYRPIWEACDPTQDSFLGTSGS